MMQRIPWPSTPRASQLSRTEGEVREVRCLVIITKVTSSHLHPVALLLPPRGSPLLVRLPSSAWCLIMFFSLHCTDKAVSTTALSEKERQIDLRLKRLM